MKPKKRCKFHFFTSLDKNVWIKKSDLLDYIEGEKRLSKKRLRAEIEKCYYKETDNE